MSKTPDFEIIVGTYEEYLLGYKISSSKNSFSLKQSFATHSHNSSIRCLSSSEKYLASGAADDRIIVYDMKIRKEHTMLTHHNSTVNCVEITPHSTHLISGSSDGVLSIVRVGSWQLEKNWDKAHKGAAILDLAVHPSGKLALTLGSDQTLRTWNLVKGRQAYAINLTTKSIDSKSLDSINWAPNEENFVLSGGLNLEIWSITTGGIINKFQFDSRVICCCWLTKKKLAIGHENGQITILNLKTDKQKTIEAHKLRVKCLKSRDNWLVSASSDGYVKLWEFTGKTIEEKCYNNIGCRCTCLSLVPIVLKEENEDSDYEEIIKTEVVPTLKRDQKCKVVIEDESQNNKKRKKKKNKNNQKKLKTND